MELGTGVFLSALFLGTVFLYIATKDRWPWKKILLWPVLSLVVIAVIGGGGWYFYYEWTEAQPPDQQDEMSGIKLGATEADVKFAKGEPPDRRGQIWIYPLGYEGRGGRLAIKFLDGKVAWILIRGEKFHWPTIPRLSAYASQEQILKKLGSPSSVSRSKDETERIVCFQKYSLCFTFGQGEVKDIAVFDPAKGAIRFSEESP